MTTSPSLDPAQSFALRLREHAIREARDAIADMADSMGGRSRVDGWSGPAADAFRDRLLEHQAKLRASLPDLDSAEATVRGWRQGL